MSRRICSQCLTTPVGSKRNTSHNNDSLCESCFEYAGWVNTHSDAGHDRGNFDPECLVCDPNGSPMPNAAATTSNPTTGRKYRSHATCGHPRTPKGRAACRAGTAHISSGDMGAIEAGHAHVADFALIPVTNIKASAGTTTVHATTDNETRFMCTKREARPTHVLTNDAVTCKNCLKGMK